MVAGSTVAYWYAEYGTWSIATVTVFPNCVTLTFDLWVNACRATTIEYVYQVWC